MLVANDRRTKPGAPKASPVTSATFPPSSRAVQKSLEMRGRLKIDVLSVLNEEQHKILVDRFPRLIYKPWTRAMGGRRAR